MTVGTRSILHGIHSFWLHPFFVAEAWRRLYGFPWSYKLWVAFFVHDLGYIGKPNMDGTEGETHPILGAKIMEWLFGSEWGDFTLRHSRHYAKLQGKEFTRLCVADKLASIIMPRWLYVGLAQSTGELKEYRAIMNTGRESDGWVELVRNVESDEDWFDCLNQYMTQWVEANKWIGDGLPKSRPEGSDSQNQIRNKNSENSLENSGKLP